jgi:hypothetical protein
MVMLSVGDQYQHIFKLAATYATATSVRTSAGWPSDLENQHGTKQEWHKNGNDNCLYISCLTSVDKTKRKQTVMFPLGRDVLLLNHK